MMTKLLKPHREGCVAVKACQPGDPNGWTTPWYLNTYFPEDIETFTADSICRRRSDKYKGSTRWIVLECNDPDCGARLAMKVEAIEDLAEFSDKIQKTRKKK